jgi:hypothetical protein
MGAWLARLGGFGLLANPWVLLVVAGLLAASHGYAYVQGRSDGAAKANLACEQRVNRLEAAYEEQAKKIDAINKAWKDALDMFIDSEAQRAKQRQDELDAANAKLDEYEKQISGDKAKCVLDQSDIDSVR